MEVKKSLENIPEEDRLQLIKKISELAIKYGVEEVTPILIDEQIFIFQGNQVIRKTQTYLKIEQIVLGDRGIQVQNFEKEIKEEVINEIDDEEVMLDLKVKLGPGCPFSPIDKVRDIFTCQQVSIFHKPGQVFLIDFWGKWCPYCHAPMKENQKIMTEHSKKWGDKFRLICISSDPSVREVALWLVDKGWESPEHYHKASSNASQEYGVDGIPYIVLVDGTGTIAYVGHPANRKDLVNDIEKMINGEEIDIDDKDKFQEFKELDLKKINEQMTQFNDKSGEFLKSKADNENFKKMAQAVMILRKQIIYNKQQQKFLINFESLNIITGPQPEIFQVRNEIEAFVKSLNLSIEETESKLRIMMEKNADDE